MIKLHELLSSVIIFTFLAVSCISSSFATNPSLSDELDDNLTIPMSPKEEHEIIKNGYIASALSDITIEKSKKEIVLKGTLDRGIVVIAQLGQPMLKSQLHLELRTSEKLPEEITNDENVSNCILKGDIYGDMLNSRVVICGNSLLCDTNNIIETKARWHDTNIKNREIGATGMVLDLDTNRSEPFKIYQTMIPKSELSEFLKEQRWNELLQITPVMFVPRKTNVEIVFPIKKK